MVLHDTIYICAHIHVYIHIDITFVCISFFVYLHLGCFSLFLFNKGKPCYNTCTLLTSGSLAALPRSVRHLCHLSATLAHPCWPQGDMAPDVPRGVALHMLSLVKKPLFRSVFFREHGKCPTRNGKGNVISLAEWNLEESSQSSIVCKKFFEKEYNTIVLIFIDNNKGVYRVWSVTSNW